MSTTTGTVVEKIYSVSGGSFSGSITTDTLTDYYTDTAHVSILFQNPGSVSIHLVSLWIVGPSGATQFASTLSGSSHFEEWVGPGQTANVTVAYSWTPGEYTLEFVSALRNINTDSATVS